MSENDYKVVPEFGEHCGESIGVGDAPNPSKQTADAKSVANRVARLVNSSGQRFETAFEFLGEGVVFQDTQGQIVLCNESAAEILGLTMDQMEGRTSVDPRWQSLKEDGTPFPGDQHPAMVALKTGQIQSNVLMNVLKPDGTRVWIKINSVPVFDDLSMAPSSVVTSFSNVSEIKFEVERLRAKLTKLQESQARVEARRKGLELANQELREAADYDAETGLRSRRYFLERLCAEVSLASRKQVPLSILIGEILPREDSDHESGLAPSQLVLEAVSELLLNTCRISDFTARYEVNKFAIIMVHTSVDEASDFAERLLKDVSDTRGLSAFQVCIGLTEYRIGWLANEFLEQAEESLFRAKINGPNTCVSDLR